MKYSFQIRSLILIFILYLLAACALIETETGTYQNGSDPEIMTGPGFRIQTPQSTSLPAPTRNTTTYSEDTKTLSHPSYHFDIRLNYTEHQLAIIQSISYTNNTNQHLSELPLIVPSAYHQNTFLLNDLQIEPDPFNTQVILEGALIRLLLDTALEPGNTINLRMDYELKPPETNGTFGYTSRQLLLADWHPFIPPFIEDRGWLINQPGAVGEFLVYPLIQFTARLEIEPWDETLVVAASAPSIRLSKSPNTYHYTAQNVRNFSLAFSHEYHVSIKENHMARVEVFTFPEHRALGQSAGILALQAWETFTELYGPNQRQFLSIVEADIADGLEADGLFYLSDWYFETADHTPKNYFELLVIHEVSHQWFYGLVSNDQAHEPWLDEALATYSELLFYETHHPDLVAWWWDFRVADYNPQGYINAPIYKFDAYRPYINAVYLRGASFLQSVRDEIGDTAFFNFLYNYAQSGLEVPLSDAGHFFRRLSQTTENDLSQLTEDYFK